jgi:hypothetical protein
LELLSFLVLKKIISQLTGDVSRAMIDPSVFQDPVALKTSWQPLARGGNNFKSAGLLIVNEQRIEFRASLMTKLRALVFVVMGLVLAAVFISKQTDKLADYKFKIADFIPVAMGVIFAAIGAGMFFSALFPAVFDLRHGYFCKSRLKPERMIDPSKLKRYAELKRVHALQIISEYCKTKKSYYYSYELNLVLDDGSRINVVDHGNQTALRADAQILANFLNKPLWDAS